MRRFLIFAVALIFSISASAQDLLVKRNGEQMKVKVLKITKKKVQFVRYGTDHPVYNLPVTDIDYIEYPFGDRDTFNKVATTPQPAPNSSASTAASKSPGMWHGAAPAPRVITNNSDNTATAARKYIVGEIYDQNGIKGIVAVLYDGGEHGLVLSLDETCLAWSSLHRKQVEKTGANDHYDGIANMKAIEKYITEKGLSWDAFPAFKWCRDKGEGWYLPSINELWSVGTMSMGGSRVALSRKFRRNYNDAIEAVGGTPLSNIMIYHSSTEDRDIRYSYYGHMNSESPNIDSGYKADKLFVRAVYKF